MILNLIFKKLDFCQLPLTKTMAVKTTLEDALLLIQTILWITIISIFFHHAWF